MQLLHLFKKYDNEEKTDKEIEQAIRNRFPVDTLKVYNYNYKYIVPCDEQIQDFIEDITIDAKWDIVFRNCDTFAIILAGKILDKKLGWPCRDVSVFKEGRKHSTVMIINNKMEVKFLNAVINKYNKVESIKFDREDGYSIDTDREVRI